MGTTYEVLDETGRLYTRSHCSVEHAASESFPQAQSADRLFSWHSGAAMYVGINCEKTGLPDTTAGKAGYHPVYLPYAPDCEPALKARPDCDDLLRRAREFVDLVHEIKRAREDAREDRDLDELEAEIAAEIASAPPIPAAVRSLVARYGSSEAAWEAEDEQAWATLRKYDL